MHRTIFLSNIVFSSKSAQVRGKIKSSFSFSPLGSSIAACLGSPRLRVTSLLLRLARIYLARQLLVFNAVRNFYFFRRLTHQSQGYFLDFLGQPELTLKFQIKM